MIADSDDNRRTTVFESSIFEVSVEITHFEPGGVAVLVEGDVCLAASESKQASLDVGVLSFAQTARAGTKSCDATLVAERTNSSGRACFMMEFVMANEFNFLGLYVDDFVFLLT